MDRNQEFFPSVLPIKAGTWVSCEVALSVTSILNCLFEGKGLQSCSARIVRPPPYQQLPSSTYRLQLRRISPALFH